MPDRYEREIEDILRNIEDYRPKPSLRERLHLRWQGQARRPQPTRLARPLRVSISEWCLLASIVLGLVAAGIAYSRGSGTAPSGALALLAVLCFLLGLFTFWRAR